MNSWTGDGAQYQRKQLTSRGSKPPSLDEYTDIHGAFNKFQAFFLQAFIIVVDTWKFTSLLLYISWDDWPIFMISGSNEQLQQELEYTLLKPYCHSWRISKLQSGREDTLEELLYCHLLIHAEIYIYILDTYRRNDKDAGRLL